MLSSFIAVCRQFRLLSYFDDWLREDPLLLDQDAVSWRRTRKRAPGRPHDTVSYWDGDGIEGKPLLRSSLGEQRAYFYKSGVLVGVSQLSTGREGLNTPYGHFSIIQRTRTMSRAYLRLHVDSAGNAVVPNVDVTKDPKPPGAHFRGTPMPYFMRIVSGTGMHAGYLPGYPASHGCIRMPEFMAENFFKSVSTGTPVTITN